MLAAEKRLYQDMPFTVKLRRANFSLRRFSVPMQATEFWNPFIIILFLEGVYLYLFEITFEIQSQLFFYHFSLFRGEIN